MTQDRDLHTDSGRVLIRKSKVKKYSILSKSAKNDPVISTSTNSTQKSDQPTCIKIAHVNINSIRNKIDLLSAELSDYYDIICVSETKLNDTVKTFDLEIDGFRIPLRKDRQINYGGGLMIYIKNNLCFKRRTELESNDIENIWNEINFLKNKFLVVLQASQLSGRILGKLWRKHWTSHWSKYRHDNIGWL